MSRNAKFAAAFAVALVLAGAAWILQGRDPEVPTAPAPRGTFASDRASDEPEVPHP